MPVDPSVSSKPVYVLLFFLLFVAKAVASEESPTSPTTCKNIYRCRDFRLSDCTRCIPSWRRKTCARFVRLSFRARLRALRTGKPVRIPPMLRRLFRSLEDAAIENTTYCLGFGKLFITPQAELDVGNNATIYSEGAGQLLTNTLQQLVPNVEVEIISNVTYSNETTSWASPTPSNSPESYPPDGGEGEEEEPEATPESPSGWGTTADGEEWSWDLSRFFSFSSDRRLSGHLRLPVSSRHVIKSNGDLRKWVILRALRKMTQASDWASAFQKDPSKFRIVQDGSKTFIVYIGFTDTFVDAFK